MLGVAADRAASAQRKDVAVSHPGRIQIFAGGNCPTHRSTHRIRYLQSGPIGDQADCECAVACVYDATPSVPLQTQAYGTLLQINCATIMS